MDIDEMRCDVMVSEDYCSTPRREECRIPAMTAPPAPPKKKRVDYGGVKQLPPKNGYFNPPDLELFFARRRHEHHQVYA